MFSAVINLLINRRKVVFKNYVTESEEAISMYILNETEFLGREKKKCA